MAKAQVSHAETAPETLPGAGAILQFPVRSGDFQVRDHPSRLSCLGSQSAVDAPENQHVHLSDKDRVAVACDTVLLVDQGIDLRPRAIHFTTPRMVGRWVLRTTPAACGRSEDFLNYLHPERVLPVLR